MTEEKKKYNSRSRKAQKYKSREAGKTEKQKSKEAGKAEKKKSRETGKHRTRNPKNNPKPAAKKKKALQKQKPKGYQSHDKPWISMDFLGSFRQTIQAHTGGRCLDVSKHPKNIDHQPVNRLELGLCVWYIYIVLYIYNHIYVINILYIYTYVHIPSLHQQSSSRQSITTKNMPKKKLRVPLDLSFPTPERHPWRVNLSLHLRFALAKTLCCPMPKRTVNGILGDING